MLTMPSFKKSLIVEQFQRNYLKEIYYTPLFWVFENHLISRCQGFPARLSCPRKHSMYLVGTIFIFRPLM